jgi:hypothetical protein
MQDEGVSEALELFCEAMENAVQVLKQALAKIPKEQAQAGLNEEAFNLLRWEVNRGSKLGEFECAFKASNIPDKWNHALNILRANNSTIKNHFAPEGFAYRYWLYLDKYQDRIFRKKRESLQ